MSISFHFPTGKCQKATSFFFPSHNSTPYHHRNVSPSLCHSERKNFEEIFESKNLSFRKESVTKGDNPSTRVKLKQKSCCFFEILRIACAENGTLFSNKSLKINDKNFPSHKNTRAELNILLNYEVFQYCNN